MKCGVTGIDGLGFIGGLRCVKKGNRLRYLWPPISGEGAGTPFGIGNDTIYGGTGDSAYYLSNSDNWLDAGGGNDYIHAGIGHNTIFAGKGNCIIYGAGGSNFINLESVKRCKREAANDECIAHHRPCERKVA